MLSNLSRLLLRAFPPLGLLGQRFGEFLHLCLDLRLGSKQLLHSPFQPGLFSAGALLLCLKLLLRSFQFWAQPAKLGFQFRAALPNLARHLLSRFPALGLLRQHFT